MLRLIENGNNVALIAPRRIGKTGLIENLYHLPKVRKKYYTFLIDIYATKNMEDMIMAMGSSMVSCLRPWGAKVMRKFTDVLASIRRWHLPSTSSVQSAIKGLLEKGFVTSTLGVYEVYDKFFSMWLRKD